ncbi:MAG: hypothetical protein K2H31_06220, partial [Lachnospiraceae bacterium]|nr:hypothetical protein [Lachnospiraceae bacterium]
MKRKIIAALLAAIMVTSVTACGNTQPNASELTSGRSVVSDEGENTEKPEETEKEEEKEPEEKEPEEKEDDKDKTAAKGVVFGSDEAKGYDG